MENQFNQDPEIQDGDHMEIQSSPMVYEESKAQVDMQIATAKQYPRNIRKVVDNVITIATMDRETALSCRYVLRRDGKEIKGPSAALARIILQNYGNMRAEAKVVSITDKHVHSEAVAWDLENNTAVKVTVMRRITNKQGQRYSEDMIVTTGNAANSIALRNAVFSVVPGAITQRAIKSVEEAIIGEISDENKLIATRQRWFANFKNKYNVPEEVVLKALNKASIQDVGREELLTLSGIEQSIKEGITTVAEQFFPTVEKTSKKPEAPSEGGTKSEKKPEDTVKKLMKSGVNEQTITAYLTWLGSFTGADPKAVWKTMTQDPNKVTMVEYLLSLKPDEIVNFTSEFIAKTNQNA